MLAQRQPVETISFQSVADAAGVSVPTARRHLGDRANFPALLLVEEKNEQRADTRARILSAAGQVFAELGYAGASLDAVARAADMTKGAIYWHFNSKAALFCELLEKRCKREQQSIESAFTHDFVQQLSLNDVQTLLVQAAEPLISDPFWPRLFVEFISHVREPDIADRLSALYEETYAEIAELQKRIREAERSDASFDDTIVAKFWATLIDGLTIACLTNPERTDIPLLAREFARIAWQGLGKKTNNGGST